MMRMWLWRVGTGAMAATLVGALLGGLEVAFALRTSITELLNALQRVQLFGGNAVAVGALAGAVGAAAGGAFGSVLGLGAEDRSLAAQTGRDPSGSWLPPTLGVAALVALATQWTPTILRVATVSPGRAAGLLLVPLVLAGALGVAARLVLRRLDTTGRGAGLAWLGLPTLLVLAMSLAVSAPMRGGRGTGTAARPGLPNLLLVTVDGLRADHVGAGARVRTSTLQWMAREGVAFTQASTPSTSEGPPVAAILTGRHPLSTGFLADGQALPGTVGGAPLPTLAEKLAAEGYSTGAFVASAGLDGRATGLSRGFEVYDDGIDAGPRGARRLALPALVRALREWGAGPPPEEVLRSASATVARLGEWMSWHAGENQFAWLHLAEPRNPSLGFEADPADLLDPIPGEAGRAYGARVVGLDEVIGDLLQGLEAEGMLDGWLIVVAGTRGHVPGSVEPSVAESFSQVPLLVFGPNVPQGVRVDAQVRLEDVPATALTAVGFVNHRFGDGYSLLPFATGGPSTALPAVVVSPPRSDGRCGIALRTGRWKFVRDARGNASLYDLLSDPREIDDVQSQHPDRAAASAEEVRGLLGKPLPEAVLAPLDPFRARTLRALRRL